MTFWLNGRVCDETIAIDIADRGFLLGDGLFETILLIDGAPVFLDRHLVRLRASAAALAFDLSYDDEEIRRAISNLARKKGLTKGRGAVRITLTRGPAGRGLDLPRSGETASTLLITATAYRPSASVPARVIFSRYKRGECSISATHKTLAYLDSIMARDEAAAAGADDAILLNSAGRIVCASAANVFLITEDGGVLTPPVSEGALPGVVRSVLLEEAPKAGAVISEALIETSLLEEASLFLTNSLVGLLPAVMASREAKMKTPNDVLKRLQSCYGDAVRRDLKGE